MGLKKKGGGGAQKIPSPRSVIMGSERVHEKPLFNLMIFKRMKNLFSNNPLA